MDIPGFLKKAKRLAGKVPFIPDIVALYFCFMDPVTPLWAKAQIAIALSYFVLPLDAVPDAIPIAGMADDGALAAGTLVLVATHVTVDHRRQAKEWLDA